MKIISLGNQKGGVAKTTTAINLSAALAMLGERVLLMDMDSQGHAGSGVGVEVHRLERTMYDVLSSKRPDIKGVILPTYVENLHLAPSNIRLAAAAVELTSKIGREFRFGQGHGCHRWGI